MDHAIATAPASDARLIEICQSCIEALDEYNAILTKGKDGEIFWNAYVLSMVSAITATPALTLAGHVAKAKVATHADQVAGLTENADIDAMCYKILSDIAEMDAPKPVETAPALPNLALDGISLPDAARLYKTLKDVRDRILDAVEDPNEPIGAFMDDWSSTVATARDSVAGYVEENLFPIGDTWAQSDYWDVVIDHALRCGEPAEDLMKKLQRALPATEQEAA